MADAVGDTGDTCSGGGVKPAKSKKVTALIIIRHAERIDDHRIPGGFVTRNTNNARNKQKNAASGTTQYDWRYDTEAGRQRPWDPPLSYGGIDQSESFGKLLPHLVEEFKLPPLGAVYASPVVRCTETAAAAVRAHDAELLAMEEDRREAKERSRAAAAATAANTTNGKPPNKQNGGVIQTKSSWKGAKLKAPTMKRGKSKPPKGPDLATTLGTVHPHVHTPALPTLSNLYDTALDIFGYNEGPDAAANASAADACVDATVASAAVTSTCVSVTSDTTSARPQHEEVVEEGLSDHTRKARTPVRIRLEQGLMECIHKQWYDQWCLIAGVPMQVGGNRVVLGEHRMKLEDKDGKREDVNDEKKDEENNNIHPMAQVPVVHCFPDPRDMVDLLGGVARSYVHEPGGKVSNHGSQLTLLPDRDCDHRVLPPDMLKRIDTTHSPFVTFPEEYVYETKYETGKAGLNRQHAAVRQIAAKHSGETVVCVTHFVPCAHLYGRLTGRDGVVEHGRAGYTAFSIYVHSDGREGEKHNDWRPLVTNDQRHLTVSREELARPAKKKYNLRSKLYGF